MQLRPRLPAPLFEATGVLPNGTFAQFSLSDYRDKWVVLLFYPMAFTFVCPTELMGFSDAMDEFADLNTRVLAVSTDTHHVLRAWQRTPREDGGLGGGLRYPMLADISKTIS